MRAIGRRSSIRVLVAFVAGALIVSGPQVAIAAFDAVNADKVDGRHAVGAGLSPAERAGKLVATNAQGFLPGNIVERVPNSNMLDGLDSTAFQRRINGTCAAGSSVRAVGATGSVTCEPDDKNGGNAQTLDDLDSTAFQPRIVGTCATGSAIRGFDIMNAVVCEPDDIDGGNAQTLDGKDSNEFQAVIDEDCGPGEAVTGIDPMGGIICATDQVDGGDAQSLDGFDSSVFAQPGGNVVLVRGDFGAAANGQALRDAIDAINPTPANPYVVHLGPGEYALGATTLVLKPEMRLVGSGREVTRLTSTTNAVSTQGALRLREHTEVSSLTLEHLPTAATAGMGIDDGDEARLVDVEVLVGGPGDIYGVHVGFNAIVQIVDSRIAAGGSGPGNEGVAVRADSSTYVPIQGSELVGVAADAPEGAAAEVHSSFATVLIENSSLRSTGVVARRAAGSTGALRIANSRLDGPTTGTNGVVCFDTYTPLLAPAPCS